jgi:hypothetical protein
MQLLVVLTYRLVMCARYLSFNQNISACHVLKINNIKQDPFFLYKLKIRF